MLKEGSSSSSDGGGGEESTEDKTELDLEELMVNGGAGRVLCVRRAVAAA
jgi:hypothetical protein